MCDGFCELLRGRAFMSKEISLEFGGVQFLIMEAKTTQRKQKS
jgi:hypothetical protein